jgi:putative ABC transport system permease protein
LSSIINQDIRPSVLFSTGGRVAPYLLIKLKNNNVKAIEAVENRLNQVVPNQYFKLTMWKNEIRNLYSESMRFRDAMLIGSIITLLIALIGLMGYTQDELNRRQKEIAIRKINGGSMKRIFNLFLKDILKVALPAITIGALAAYFALGYWLQEFTVKTELSLFIFLGCALVALLIIILVMAQHFARVANANPVKALKCD